jgi:hypothetical protein
VEVKAVAAGIGSMPVMVISGDHDRVVSPRRYALYVPSM